ncbi:MAG TPA: hypothetical protein VHK06_08250, partial [Candidatus Limnocylindria bacterium]|nr:hypothetical protein [Candidatus Limnocylindria bacterium]
TARALVPAAGRVRLALGTAGDRTDEILHRLGVVSGELADEVVIGEKLHYLRGRDRAEMNRILSEGVARGKGIDPAGVEVHPTEQAALAALIARSRAGDVALVMSHAERAELFAWLRAAGFAPVGLARLRELLAERRAETDGAPAATA